ncbi:hypothetical protein BN1708_016494, partial [Verticillium longisporum]
FLAADFDPASYLSNLPHRHQTLDDLKSDLRERSAAISAELLELVNSNYTAFLSLGDELRGGDDKVEDVKVAMLGFRRQIEEIKSRVRTRKDEAASLTGELGDVRKEIETGRRMLELDDRVSALEEKLAVASMPGKAPAHDADDDDAWSVASSEDSDAEDDEVYTGLHLTLRTYVEGYTLGETETKIWQTLKSNNAGVGFIKKGSLVNLTRWFNYISQAHPEIQAEAKAAEAARKAKIAAGSKAGGNFDLALQNADQGVVTRFLPEPSGYLHIGHAKAALLSDYFAHEAYKGQLRLRLDDTNPSKESEEFQDSIVEDLALMGITPDTLTYTSDYFDYLHDMCKRLITEGHAYSDDTDQETMKAQRMDGIESKCRNRTIEENLRIFEEMKLGSAEGVKNCIRAKVSVDNPNKAMRDPVIYRCNIEHKHHRTGDKWKAYPTYDLACPLVDSKEGVTHALRSTEYTDRNPLYQWFIDTLKIRQVYMWDFSRINFVRTLMSKRKLASLVNAGTVDGWDDPRFPTIRGVRRRGLTIPALREFIIKQGPSRNVVNMDWASLWALNKKVIDPIAPRHTALIEK